MIIIKLEELSKSKEFMKHVKIADNLTKETELEHGFIFCKSNNGIIVDRMCVGTGCHINIKRQQECYGSSNNTFHTHPNSSNSDLSVVDLVGVANKSFFLKKPSIKCVKASEDDNIFCVKSDVLNTKDISDINEKANDQILTYMEKEDFIYDTLLPETITINIKNK